METNNVFLFVPNIIGYVRVVLAVLSCGCMPTYYKLACWSYIVSAVLDAFDGEAARRLNQCSRFGAMLDMLTDRCATMCLLMVLGSFYPSCMFLFQMSAAIDIASHWLHMHSHDLKGSKSHKKVDEKTNPVLKLYYTSRIFLFFMCAGNEGFYTMLYLAHFTYGPIIPLIGFGVWPVLAFVFFPIAVVKTSISLVHLFEASRTVADVDVAERAIAAAAAAAHVD